MTDFQCGSYRLPRGRPCVMGILNVTPDSFSDGGHHAGTDQAVAHAEQMILEGADIVDVGGESTRPGALPVSVVEEISRVVPVVRALVRKNIPVSVDTRHRDVMDAVLQEGASMINDIQALQEPGALSLLAGYEAAICLMHMQGEPGTMQRNPLYGDVVSEVWAFLHARARIAEQSGIGRSRILLDPGFGFGKTLDHNLALLRTLETGTRGDYPVLVGMSRKSFLGHLTGQGTGDRLVPSVAAALVAVSRGVWMLRVHDVAPTCQALKIWQAVNGGTDS